jgi:hypothetical protein
VDLRDRNDRLKLSARLLVAIGLATVGCGGRAGPPPKPSKVPFTVDPVACPTAQESGAGKVTHEAYLRAHPDLTHSVTVRLRELPWDPPACAGDKSDSARCPERAEALKAREALNLKQATCVFEAFGPPGSLKAPLAHWYEPPRLRSNGVPTPVGTSFSVLALWSQLEVVARHPYVESIQPAIGEAARIDVPAAPIPAECPAANEPPAPKLVDAAGIEGLGRQPVVIELRKAMLPELESCADGADACDELHASGWERTIVARRVLTCVRSWLDSKLRGAAPEVAYSQVDGVPEGPKLPPFGDTIHATLAFGLALTWEEANEVAKHPGVERVWTSPSLTVGTLPLGCPPNYDAPVQPPACPTTSEADSIDAKFTAASRAAWEASTGPQEVVIAVRRANDLCPRPACPGRATTCPEAERYNDRLMKEAEASQTCVRQVVASSGGMATTAAFPLGNSFGATLTWGQTQIVAAHPHVGQIDGRYSSPPP